MTEGLTLVLRNRLEDIGGMCEAVEAFFAARDLDPRAAAHMTLALDELATNVISYAFEPGAELDAALRITLRHDGQAVWAVMEDEGRPFDPLSVPEADTAAELDARRVGGLGVHLARQVVDEIAYERADGCNRLRLCKRL